MKTLPFISNDHKSYLVSGLGLEDSRKDFLFTL